MRFKVGDEVTISAIFSARYFREGDPRKCKDRLLCTVIAVDERRPDAYCLQYHFPDHPNRGAGEWRYDDALDDLQPVSNGVG